MRECKIPLAMRDYFDISIFMKIYNFEDDSLVRAAQAFAALGSEQRLTVLLQLVRACEDGLSIGALGEKTGVSGSTLTHHLRFLAQAGLIKQTKLGRTITCTATFDVVHELSEFLLLECCCDAPNHPNHDRKSDG
jgi:ArsR family transcriptional regulator